MQEDLPLDDQDGIGRRDLVEHLLSRRLRQELQPVRGACAGQIQLDHAAPGAGRRVHHHRAGDGQRAGEATHRPADQALADVTGLGVAVEDGVDHVVVGAGADRVVGGVADDLPPGQVEQGLGPVGGGGEQGGQRLGQPLQRALGHGGGHLHVGPVGAHAHEQVGSGAGPQLAGPVGEALGGGVGYVLGQRADDQLDVVLQLVGLQHDPAQPGSRGLVIGAHHPEDGPVQQGLVGADEPVDEVEQRLGVVGDPGPVAVALGQVLSPDGGAVGGLPPEPAAVHGRRHAPPDDGVLEAELGQDLGHLGDVAEHVGQVADVHGPPEGRGPSEAQLQVADQGLARHQELVGQGVPRAHGQATGRGQATQGGFGLGADLEVVVDHRHLAVEQEVPERGVGLEPGEEVVEQVDQLQPEPLERGVPLPVPVRVGDDRHGARHALRVRPWPNPAPDGSRLGGMRRSRNPASDESLSHKPSTWIRRC